MGMLSKLGCLALIAVLAASAQATGAGLKIGDENTCLKVSLLLQGWAVFTDEGAPNPESLDTDLYLRRIRVLLFGQLNDRVNFFVETDNPNLGKRGDFSSKTFVQDAWVEFDINEAVQIDMGMLLLPFSHHGMQGAVSLHSLDYHGGLVRYPSGSHKVWRDFGVMARGLLFDRLLEYRLAVLNGVHGGDEDPRNPNDWPRLTTHLALNFFDAEGGAGTGGFFYDGLYLKKTEVGIISPKKVLSIGISADWQKDLNVSLRQTSGVIGDREDYFALAGDVFFDFPLAWEGRLGLSGQVNFYYYEHGDRRAHSDGSPASFYAAGDTYQAEYTGYGLLSELGLRYDAYELVVSLDWFEATDSDGDEGDLVSACGGFNWWWFGHASSVKLQIGRTRRDGGAWGFTGQLQVQLLF